MTMTRPTTLLTNHTGMLLIGRPHKQRCQSCNRLLLCGVEVNT